jgi:hypothetical protein
MSDDRSPDRRERAVEYLTFAQQIADPKIRVSVLGMAQKWLDRAELSDAELHREDASDKALRLRAIQTQIGRELRTRLGLPRELPPRIFTALMQLDSGRGSRTR